MTAPDPAAGSANDSANPGNRADADEPADPAIPPSPRLAAKPAPPGSLLPEQSREDTDAAWGEYTRRDDDHLYQDRPPHWRDS